MRYALWPVRQHALALRDSDMIRVISRYCGNCKKSIKLMFKVQLYSIKIKLTLIKISFNLIFYSLKFVQSLGFKLDTMLVRSSLIHPEPPLPLVSPDHRPRHKNRDHRSQEISFLFQAPLELWERNLAAHTQTISKYF